MGGAATLGDNLLDDLLSTIDDLRQLATDLGVRQFRVFVEQVTWSGGERGVGTPTVVSSELTPAPAVTFPPSSSAAVHYEHTPAGRLEEGDALLTEVSLTYTEAELTGGTIASNVEFRYRLSDGQGQAIPDRYYVPAAPPVADREKTIGWKVQLRRVEPITSIA